MSKKDRLHQWGAVSGGAGAAVVATAAMACCVPIVAPLVVSLLGVSGAIWAAGLKPYSPSILAAAGGFLGYGFWVVYRQQTNKTGAACSTKGPVAVRVVLWISVALWVSALVLNVLQFVAPRFA
jgi:mercuric ion transport protein